MSAASAAYFLGVMSVVSSVIEPNPFARAFHDQKQRGFLRMHDDQLAYRREMQ